MAEGGKRGDVGTKQDAPSQDVSKAGPEVEAAEAKAAEGQEKAAEAAEAKPKPKRAPAKPKAPASGTRKRTTAKKG